MATLVQMHELVEKTAEWRMENLQLGASELEDEIKVNQAIQLRCEKQIVTFCALVSVDASHLAAIEACPSQRNITCTVYELIGGFQRRWSVSYHDLPEGFESDESLDPLDDQPSLQGGLTSDGQAALLLYRPAYGVKPVAYIVTPAGFIPRTPPDAVANSRLMPNGVLSEDGEHILFVRRAEAQDKRVGVIEVYSIRHLALVRTFNLTVRDSRNLRTWHLIRQPRAEGPIYMVIPTATLENEEEEAQPSPPLIVSSDGKVHWNFAAKDADLSREYTNIFISQEGSHMCYVESRTAMLHYWNLRNPSFYPLSSVKLPGVEPVHGDDTGTQDAIQKQSYLVRYSANGKVMTAVTVNNGSIAINVLLAYNLQLLYHQVLKDPTWTDLVPLHLGFSDSAGLNVFTMHPAAVKNADNYDESVALLGVLGIVLSSREVFSTVRRIEHYFDYTTDNVSECIASVSKSDATSILRFRWVQNDMRIVWEGGEPCNPTGQDKQRQLTFNQRIFANKSSNDKPSKPELAQQLVPFLFGFAYPWDEGRRVSVFAILMKYEYYLIAIGPPAGTGSEDIIRVLYVSNRQTGSVPHEVIEVHQVKANYILYVHNGSHTTLNYSGVPMPCPRWTVISPHFLEEDAWYDLFIVHRSHHVILPTGMKKTPNAALVSTASFYAYFPPFAMAEVDWIEYGHRAQPAYAAPKYLLWTDRGLRGGHKSNFQQLSVDGASIDDAVAPDIRSVYDDATYDDSKPFFPSTFALTCTLGYQDQTTKYIDAFFRRMHQDPEQLLYNCRALSCVMPVACRVRPTAALSLMRHVTLFPLRINDLGPVHVKKGGLKSNILRNDTKSWKISRFMTATWAVMTGRVDDSRRLPFGPNSSHITVPLPGFCSFQSKIYPQPPIMDRRTGSSFWSLVLAAWPSHIRSNSESPVGSDSALLNWAKRFETKTASPFTRLVEAILDMKDQETQLAFLRVVWFEKLLAWKLHTFGRRVFLTRVALPMLLLFFTHLMLGIVLTEQPDSAAIRFDAPVIILTCAEAGIATYLLGAKIRQLRGAPRGFLRSIYNGVDLVAVTLSFTTVLMIAAAKSPPRPFLGFSALVLWLALAAMVRVYAAAGVLLVLLGETLRGVVPFFGLLLSILIGFAMVPLLLLRHQSADLSDEDLILSLFRDVSQLMNLDGTAADPVHAGTKPYMSRNSWVTFLRAMYVVVIAILALNILIAMLNLKMHQADRRVGDLYRRQMARLQVEIERGLLTSRERARRDWFPAWFAYTATETEQRDWAAFVAKHPSPWLETNGVGADRGHAATTGRGRQRCGADAPQIRPTTQRVMTVQIDTSRDDEREGNDEAT